MELIENASLLEQAVDKEFQLENKLLQQENDIMELEMAGQAKQKKIDTLEMQHAADLELIDDMKGELEDINGYHSTISKGRLLLNAGVVATEVYSDV